MIVLASSSPRRTELLTMLGIPHVVDPADVDERHEPGELPETLGIRLARAKAKVVAARHPDKLVLAADTLVVLEGEILGKPGSPHEAEQMLQRLAGRQHRVVTAVAMADGDTIRERCDVTRVWFRALTDETIQHYVATDEPLDKAGAYGVQGLGAVLIDRIDGDYFGVMGLPLRFVIELLEAAGDPYRFTR